MFGYGTSFNHGTKKSRFLIQKSALLAMLRHKIG